jgi:hypothetical protein
MVALLVVPALVRTDAHGEILEHGQMPNGLDDLRTVDFAEVVLAGAIQLLVEVADIEIRAAEENHGNVYLWPGDAEVVLVKRTNGDKVFSAVAGLVINGKRFSVFSNSGRHAVSLLLSH